MSTLLIQLLIAAGIFVAGGAAGIRWHAGQDAIRENARLELVREQERASRATERQQATTVLGAINEARKREILARADASGAVDALGKLRSAIAIRPEPASSAACTSDVRADTLGKLLSSCAAEYQGLAERADRLDSDRRTLMEAWPRP